MARAPALASAAGHHWQALTAAGQTGKTLQLMAQGWARFRAPAACYSLLPPQHGFSGNVVEGP
jgi:hypothetical protein